MIFEDMKLGRDAIKQSGVIKLINIFNDELLPVIQERLSVAQKEHEESWLDPEYDLFDAMCGGNFFRTMYEVGRKLLAFLKNGDIRELADAIIYIAIYFGRIKYAGKGK